MAQFATSSPFECGKLEPMEAYFYLAPQATALETCSVAEMPEILPGSVRLVCISDTHNEHACLRMPKGDILLHTGDVLTESGLRHVTKDMFTGEVTGVTPVGEDLFVNFAVWFGALDFKHKVLVAGNHDMVLQGLGKQRVQQILSEHATIGTPVYLEDDVANVGGVRIYGSPHANYSSHNNAFKVNNPTYNIPTGVHIVATHMPAVLPGKKNQIRAHREITNPMFAAGALLHVGGHCHWANGLYFAEHERKRIPCVVASVCDSQWLNARQLASVDAVRGDPTDRSYGGYNLVQPGFIVDLSIPENSSQNPPPSPVADFVVNSHDDCIVSAPTRARSSIPRRAARLSRHSASKEDDAKDANGKPLLLFFCPNDPALLKTLHPQLEGEFIVHCFEEAADACAAASTHPYQACVSKLGTKGNLGRDVIAAFRSARGLAPFVAIHSATAGANPATRGKLNQDFCINYFTQHGDEAGLLVALRSATYSDIKPLLLVFAPPNDPDFLPALQPLLPDTLRVDVFHQAVDCIEAARQRSYIACFAKLGNTEGNLGVDVIAALRGEQGDSPFVALHSATVARRPEVRKWMSDELGVNYFTEHGGEADMIQAAMQHLTQAENRFRAKEDATCSVA